MSRAKKHSSKGSGSETITLRGKTFRIKMIDGKPFIGDEIKSYILPPEAAAAQKATYPPEPTGIKHRTFKQWLKASRKFRADVKSYERCRDKSHSNEANERGGENEITNPNIQA